MKKNLFLRTDVLPEELPIQFSNRSVYTEFTKQRMKLYENGCKLLDFFTIPLFFHIPKTKDEKRKIGLLHPIAQIQTFNYILRYDQLILSFCRNSSYSVRSPIKRNNPKYKEIERKKREIEKIEEEFNFKEKLLVTSEEDQVLFYNYFSYDKYKKITELYNSPKFNRDKYKYNYFLKLDIQRCFPSIYTHSLAWAIFGDKALAKQSIRANTTFPNASDKISQLINFNETHGLVVGPEFSRIIAELLLTRIDVNLELYARRLGLENKREYSLYRYIDDYFIFSKKKENIELIQEYLRNELEKYNLTLNVNKTELQEKPFEIYDISIINLKKILKEFDLEKLLSANKKGIPHNEYKGEKNQWNSLFFKIENLIFLYPNSKRRVVNYFLKAIRESVFYDGEPRHKFVLANIIEIVTNIYTLDINYQSTNYLIAICIKLHRKLGVLEKECNEKLEEYSIEDDRRKTVEFQKEAIIFLEEKIFQHLYLILKNNLDEIENMYDILVFMKSLKKKISPSFLCKILSLNTSYFICCSVGYYILNEELTGLDLRYITVSKKLKKIIEDKVNNYEEKGAKFPILESDFFYFLNDFSKFPGFYPGDQVKLHRKLVSEYKKSVKKENGVFNQDELDIWESITKYSYYNWYEKNDTFVRKIAKKSSNLSRTVDLGIY